MEDSALGPFILLSRVSWSLLDSVWGILWSPLDGLKGCLQGAVGGCCKLVLNITVEMPVGGPFKSSSC